MYILYLQKGSNSNEVFCDFQEENAKLVKYLGFYANFLKLTYWDKVTVRHIG
jgi:hypothetical protein